MNHTASTKSPSLPEHPALLVLVSGIMGAGKGTVTEALLQSFGRLNVGRAISATTRHKRPGEREGERYIFLTKEEFLRREADGGFLEVNPAFANGERYGTLASVVVEKLSMFDILFHELNVGGMRALRALYRKERKEKYLFTVFVKPNEPWRETVLARIGEDTQNPRDGIKARLKEAEEELAAAGEYDLVVENKDGALKEAVHAIVEVIERRRAQL